MSLVYLTKAIPNAGPIECPNCKQSINIDWNTEYNDPIPGDLSAFCPHCDKEFTLSTQIEVSYLTCKKN